MNFKIEEEKFEWTKIFRLPGRDLNHLNEQKYFIFIFFFLISKTCFSKLKNTKLKFKVRQFK